MYFKSRAEVGAETEKLEALQRDHCQGETRVQGLRLTTARNESRNELKRPLISFSPKLMASGGAYDSLAGIIEANSILMSKQKAQKGAQPSGPEVDGRQAWFTLALIFVINANTLGSLKIYGLIFEEIVSQNYYNREEASWPIATASTIQNLAGLLTPIMALRISWRSIEIIQTILFVGANLGAYYSGTLAIDIFCLGIVQGVAFSLRYNMNVVINNDYFVKYRATAMGVSLAGSTCGVFILKPLISHVLDNSAHNFRQAYLALAIVMSLNILLNFFIRKPNSPIRPGSPDSQTTQESFVSTESGESAVVDSQGSRTLSFVELLKTPSIHCIWIMQTIYFYISRTYTIFIVDYGIDSGFVRADSRSLLNFWVYGEMGGRLLLGGYIDSRLLSLRWNIVIVNVILALSGFALLSVPTVFNQNSTLLDNITNGTAQSAPATTSNLYYWSFGLSVALIAALSSLVNILIVPFGQEYLGKRNVPWAFAIGSIVTSVFLLFRPSLIGVSRDYYHSYDLLIVVMSTGPLVYALLFAICEPCLKRYQIRSSYTDNYG